jgi:glycosyltransferase involved in cell wall biosynthesis
LAAADLILVEYGRYYRFLDYLPILAHGETRIVFQYYGITPLKWWGAHNRDTQKQALANRGLVWWADAAFTPSRFAQQELEKATRFPSDCIYQLPLPIDTDWFSPGPSALREELNLRDATILLYVGRLASNKRPSMIVEALERLRRLMPAVHGVFVGDVSDAYQLEMDRCRDQARQLGIEDRVHFLGQQSSKRLRDAYRSASVLVIPSRHEGYCLPVVEAMACGLPVVAARTSALRQTIGSAGLTFTPDDANDLARQIRRVIEPAPPLIRSNKFPRHVAVVSYRYGDGFVGGAEASLRLIGSALRARGYDVEVFTTCTRNEEPRANETPEGSAIEDGIRCHRFPIDHYEPLLHNKTLSAVLNADGSVADELEQQYLRQSVRSTALLDALRRRNGEFDVFIVGPYLSGIAADIARQFGPRTVLVPCFHEEPLARLRLWPGVYGDVGGVLYHSPEEEVFAEADLGINSPGGTYMGSYLNLDRLGDPGRGRRYADTGRPYLVYCGRYVKEKNLPTLLEFAQRYAGSHPNRYAFVFIGQGNLTIPRTAWARDLGFLEESVKNDVIAGAVALVNLSVNESLSFVALEAWGQGVPVIGSAECEVFAGHLRRGAGGVAVNSYETFAAALDDLWDRPELRERLGQNGRDYVSAQFGSFEAFANRLEQAVNNLQAPLATRMRERGIERAALCSRKVWREQFSQLLDEVMEAPARLRQDHVDVKSRLEHRTTAAGSQTTLVSLRVENRGTTAALADGPARTIISASVRPEKKPAGPPTSSMPLPFLLLPGQARNIVMPVQTPTNPGTYELSFAAIRTSGGREKPPQKCVPSSLKLTVKDAFPPEGGDWADIFLLEAGEILAAAQRLQRLPDDYADIVQGRFAKWKAWLKQKLLGNFKRGYVDVLSRQQSAFNERAVATMHELIECISALGRNESEATQNLRAELAEARQQIEAITERLRCLEAPGVGPVRNLVSGTRFG